MVWVTQRRWLRGEELARVYVSSTITDLTEERRAVLDWLRQARHHAVDSYLPDSGTLRQSCLDDIGTCDVYVLILGHRYGFQPVDDNPEGLSITHLEFREAGKRGIPRVALLRTSVPDVRLSDLEDPARAPLVLGFRDEVTREVRPAEFGDLHGLVLGLSTGIQGELNKRAKRDERDEPQAGPVATGRALRLMARPVFLAGREELLAALDARLTGDGTRPRVVALCGLGGAGKTSLALEYAHRQLDVADVAWQFGAEDPAVLVAGFGELAAQLGAADRGDPVAAAHGVLAARRAPWLLVFDDAPGRASVDRFVPPAGPGRVLITSRNPNWPGQALEVPVLDPQVAAEFLVNRTGDVDRRAALELAAELGGLPLALEQAAAYVQFGVDSLAEYLSLFRQRRADVLRRAAPAEDSQAADSQTVATTWRLAFDNLRHAAPCAVGLLRLLAFCASEAIPLRLLLRPRPALDEQLGEQLGGEVAPVLRQLLEDRLAADDAIAALRRYSLVTLAGDGLVSVHRLVQAVTADQMSAELAGAWRRAAAAVLEAALPADPEQPENWAAYAALLSHAKATLAADSRCMTRIVDYLGYSGSYAAASELGQQVVSARARVLGPEHPDTLAARSQLASWNGLADDPAAARDQLTALLPVSERVLGREHPDTLETSNNLALFTGLAGDPAAARDRFAALLPVYERVLGPEHPVTLTAAYNLASWTGQAGEPAAARDQFAGLLPVRERVSGPEHPETLITRHELARWTGDAGEPAAARDQFAALLPVRERVLGLEHRETLMGRRNLARWTGQAGDPAVARDQLAALLPVSERVLGPEHPDTLAARHEHARWTGQAGDPAAARDQFAALLPVRERVLGPEHPGTAETRQEYARWTRKAG